MIYVNGNTPVTNIVAKGKTISSVYHGRTLVWNYTAEGSCFGSGKWIGAKPWLGADAWKNNEYN